MAKYKYVLIGPEAGATGAPVMKELASYEGDYLSVGPHYVEVRDFNVEYFIVAVIRLAEGQSIKRIEEK